MEELEKELFEIIDNNGYSKEEVEKIKRAYQFALKQHKGMKRKNNDEYITHPLNVAIICGNLNSDANTIVASLIHETIDHGSSNLEEIEELFGTEVKEIVESLTKVNRLHLLDDSESSAIYLRKVLVALAEDVRVIIIKLAGRLHNMRTIEGLPPYKQKSKALETINVLIPIAHRLGINSIKSELEDLCFKVLKPEIYDEIDNELPKSREELEVLVNDVMEEICTVLKNNNIKFESKCRIKSVSSLHNKLSNGKKWNEIYDILGIRIICESESDCYLIIGLIHALYRPIPSRFKDYIAMPKGNSYQSLHTGIFGPMGIPVEVQVRTYEMNEIAEHGIASHWSYKEKNSRHIQNVMEQKLQMFRNIIESSSNDIPDDQAFINNVSEELLNDSIYVFTPKGDVVDLPASSTPIDFAYRIHSKVGDTTVGAIVNDVMVPLDYKLKDNDIVKIMTNKDSTPNKDWLTFVKTTAAKTKIKAYFSKQDKEEYINRGRLLFERELKRQHISLSDAMSDEHINKLIGDLKVNSFEDVLLLIGSLRYTPVYIVNLLYEDKKNISEILVDKVNSHVLKKVNYKNDILVSGIDNILVNLADCCKPVYGDEIVGYITKGQGISVHKADCVNIKNTQERLIDVAWNDALVRENNGYMVNVKVITNGTNINISDIVSKGTIRNVNVVNINETHVKTDDTIDLIVKVKNKELLDLFIDDVKSINNIIDVRRV